MKIIFNHNIDDWYWQIYEELARNYEVILPENYKRRNGSKFVDLDALKKVAQENSDADLIFDFRGTLLDLIKWKKFKINIPLVIFGVNGINRPYLAKTSLFAKLWYVEYYAKPLMEKYNRENLIYEGMAANPNIFHSIKIRKIYDIGFIGRHYGERGYWLNIINKFSLEKRIKPFFPLGHGVDMYFNQDQINKIYNQTKINITFAPKEPPGRIVNLRTFEVCMSGNFQLMQYTPCIEEYFQIDSEIVCWKNKKDLIEKILYYLENEDEREKIAKNGHNRALKDHTWSKRIEKIRKSLLKVRKKMDIRNFIIKYDKFLKKNTIDKIKNLPSNEANRENFKIPKTIFEYFGYKKRDLNRKTKINVRMKKNSFYYKPNLENFRFVEFYGEIKMVIKAISFNSEIKSSNWNELKRVLLLIENLDGTLPQFGLLTNGYDWIIRDFRHEKWLRTIPAQRVLKVRKVTKSYIMLKLIHFSKIESNKYFKIRKLFPSKGIRRFLRNFRNSFLSKFRK